MKKYKWFIILLNLLLLIGFFNYSLVKKEEILKDGKLILLELAPIDPRSMMQGDYMELNYAVSQNRFLDFLEGKLAQRGYCVVNIDNNGVAGFLRLQPKQTPLEPGEYLIEYNSGTFGQIKIGAEAFFFQEGEGQKYENARYGGVKVDKHGNSILTGLYDENRVKL